MLVQRTPSEKKRVWSSHGEPLRLRPGRGLDWLVPAAGRSLLSQVWWAGWVRLAFGGSGGRPVAACWSSPCPPGPYIHSFQRNARNAAQYAPGRSTQGPFVLLLLRSVPRKRPEAPIFLL